MFEIINEGLFDCVKLDILLLDLKLELCCDQITKVLSSSVLVISVHRWNVPTTHSSLLIYLYGRVHVCRRCPFNLGAGAKTMQ